MQAVVVAGGLGTRLRLLTERLPKALVPVCGTPFIDYQLSLLRQSGITDVVLCVGHLWEQIQAHVGDGARLGLTVRYGVERDRLLGTAGALKQVEHLLDEVFFVTYGDGYLVLPYRRVLAQFQAHAALGLMVVYKNRNRHGRSNIALDGKFVALYDADRARDDLEYIDFGVSLLRRGALDGVPPGTPYSLERLYGVLVARRELLAYRTHRRFYEIGSPGGLAEFERLVRTKRLPQPPGCARAVAAVATAGAAS